MERKSADARCYCLRVFRAPTEHEALGKLRKHVENLAGLEELHGLKELKSSALDVPELLLAAALREEVDRLLEARKTAGEEWRFAEELELTRQVLRWSILQQHEAAHGDAEGTWRECRQAICLYAQMTLPEVEEVEWI